MFSVHSLPKGSLLPGSHPQDCPEQTALKIAAVTLFSLENVPYLVHVRSMIDSTADSGSADTRVCELTSLISAAHSLGISFTVVGMHGSKPVFNHSGPHLQSLFTVNSSKGMPLDGKLAGL